MASISFEIEQGWSTIDEMTKYFSTLIAQLKALKTVDAPTDWYIRVDGAEIADEERDKIKIVLSHL